MKRFLITLFYICLLGGAYAQQDYWSRFIEEYEKRDSLAMKRILKEWQELSPDHADLHAAWYNYYLWRAKEEVIQISTELPPNQNENLVLTDSLGNHVGYMYSAIRKDSFNMNQAYAWIDKGIYKHPDRLDLRFGKLTTLLNEKKYDIFISDIILALKQSKINNNQWKWTGNEPMLAPEGEDVFLNGLQDYFATCFESNTPQTDSVAKNLIKELLIYYPDNVKFRTNDATIYFLNGKYDEALKRYLAILKDYPKDTILIANVAYVYSILKDYPMAITYYERLKEVGDNEQKKFSEQQIQIITEQMNKN